MADASTKMFEGVPVVAKCDMRTNYETINPDWTGIFIDNWNYLGQETNRKMKYVVDASTTFFKRVPIVGKQELGPIPSVIVLYKKQPRETDQISAKKDKTTNSSTVPIERNVSCVSTKNDETFTLDQSINDTTARDDQTAHDNISLGTSFCDDTVVFESKGCCDTSPDTRNDYDTIYTNQTEESLLSIEYLTRAIYKNMHAPAPCMKFCQTHHQKHLQTNKYGRTYYKTNDNPIHVYSGSEKIKKNAGNNNVYNKTNDNDICVYSGSEKIKENAGNKSVDLTFDLALLGSGMTCIMASQKEVEVTGSLEQQGVYSEVPKKDKAGVSSMKIATSNVEAIISFEDEKTKDPKKDKAGDSSMTNATSNVEAIASFEDDKMENKDKEISKTSSDHDTNAKSDSKRFKKLRASLGRMRKIVPVNSFRH